MLAGGAVTTDGTEVLGARQRVSRRVLARGGAEAGGVAGADGEGRCGHAAEGEKNTVNTCLCRVLALCLKRESWFETCCCIGGKLGVSSSLSDSHAAALHGSP